jgi:hypothetical protein
LITQALEEDECDDSSDDLHAVRAERSQRSSDTDLVSLSASVSNASLHSNLCSAGHDDTVAESASCNAPQPQQAHCPDHSPTVEEQEQGQEGDSVHGMVLRSVRACLHRHVMMFEAGGCGPGNSNLRCGERPAFRSGRCQSRRRRVCFCILAQWRTSR